LILLGRTDEAKAIYDKWDNESAEMMAQQAIMISGSQRGRLSLDRAEWENTRLWQSQVV